MSISLLYLIAFILSIVLAPIHLYLSELPHNKQRIMQVLSLYLLVFVVGIPGAVLGTLSILAALGWIVSDLDRVVFLWSVGIGYLLFSVLAFMGILVRKRPYWLAVSWGYTIFICSSTLAQLFRAGELTGQGINIDELSILALVIPPFVGFFLRWLPSK